MRPAAMHASAEPPHSQFAPFLLLDKSQLAVTPLFVRLFFVFTLVVYRRVHPLHTPPGASGSEALVIP